MKNGRSSTRRRSGSLVVAIACLWLASGASPAAASPQVEAPRILLDQPERIVEYQLNRLTRDQLINVERRDTDVRYRPVYRALLRRDGVPISIREEAAAALVKLGPDSRTAVLVEALSRLEPEAESTAAQLTRLLVQQPVEELQRQAAATSAVLAAATAPTFATAASYAVLLVTTADTAALWTRAAASEGHLEALLKGAAFVPGSAALVATRSRLADLILKAWSTPVLQDPASRAAAVTVLASVRLDDATVRTILGALRAATDNRVRAAAVRALSGAATATVPADQIEPAIEVVTGWVGALPPDDRARPEVLDALALADALATRLPAARATAARRTVRALGAQVVRIGTLFEQVSFDVRWFAVEAGRPVQIVLANTDAMPHNVVIGKPGSLEAIGTAANAMSPPASPEAKAFVPDLPEVLFSTRLAQQDETVRVGFVAPAEPGSYVFVCTFPGHWVRMYGVMLVVPDLEAWEGRPTVPLDPMTHKPFAQRLIGR